MLRTIINSLQRRLAEIGSSLFQNYKLDYQNRIEYIKFITLTGYQDILRKMDNGTINYRFYSYDRDRILETIRTQISTKW
jgi:hypothetical protein